jgi:hypothetical protein
MLNSTMEAPTATQIANHDVSGLADRLLKLTLLINLALPGFLFLVVYLLKSVAILPSNTLIPSGTLQVIFYTLLFVAASEVGVAFILKKAFFAPEKVRPALHESAAFAKLVTAGSITLAALGASAMFYGVVLYMLGLEIKMVALFALIALVHFRLFRPTADSLRSLIAQAS